MSLHVTAMCWGAGAVLQIAVLCWVQSNADLKWQQGACLQVVVTLGVIGGASMAACNGQIFSAYRALLWGLISAAGLPWLRRRA
jgi:LPLT family lysophospholipid transporter-like MFS transporter